MPVRYMPPNDDPDLKPYILFPNSGGGFGHALTERGYETSTGYAYPEGYHRTANMTVSNNGTVLSPSFANASNVDSFAGYKDIAFAIPWSDTSTPPIPVVIVGTALGTSYSIAGNGATTDSLTMTGFLSDGVLFADESGVATIYAGCVTSLVTEAAGFILKRTQAGVWTQDADVAAKHLCAAAGNLWRASSDYTVSKCPAGSNPFTLGNWGANFQVGTNDAKINSMGATGSVVWIGKEDGIWEYKEADARYENVLPTNVHPKNYRWMKSDGEGGLLTAPYDGSLVRISQFGSITVYHPLRGKKPGRDTPRGPITNACVVGDTIYCTMDGCNLTVQSSGVKVLKTLDNFSTFTDYSSNAIDGSRSSVITVSSMDTPGNGDALLVGFSDQFMAIEFFMTAANSNAATLTASFSTGAGTWTALTLMGEETNGFFYNGIMSFDFSGVDLSTWVTATYNSLTAYWIKITTNVAFDASTTIGEVFVLPRRTGPAFTTTNADSSEHMEASGAYSKVLRLRLEGDTPIWDDVYTLRRQAANAIVMSDMSTPNSPHGSLWVFGSRQSQQFPLLPTPSPHLAAYPVLARDALTTNGTVSQATPIYYPSTVNLADRHRCEYIDIYTKDMSVGSDIVRCAVKMGSFEEWYVSGDSKQRFSRFEFKNAVGDELSVAVQLLDAAATDPSGPYITNIVAWLREVDDYGEPPTQVARATPEIS